MAMFDEDDGQLARRAAGGEQAAFSVLMGRWKEPLYRSVRRLVGDADEARDVVQDAFVAAWISLRSFDAEKPLGPWLRRIALNKCRDRVRRRKVRAFFFQAVALDAPAARKAAASAAEEEDARLGGLDRAIAALPTQLKEPLVLTAIDGLSHKEAALVLGISVKAVETRVARAKNRLWETIEPLS